MSAFEGSSSSSGCLNKDRPSPCNTELDITSTEDDLGDRAAQP